MASKKKRSSQAAANARSGATQRISVFQKEFREDLAYWVDIDRKIAARVLRLVEETLRDPFDGLGKPEPLKYPGPDIWSRRIEGEHRMVYLVSDRRIDFLMARYHY